MLHIVLRSDKIRHTFFLFSLVSFGRSVASCVCVLCAVYAGSVYMRPDFFSSVGSFVHLSWLSRRVHGWCFYDAFEFIAMIKQPKIQYLCAKKVTTESERAKQTETKKSKTEKKYPTEKSNKTTSHRHPFWIAQTKLKLEKPQSKPAGEGEREILAIRTHIQWARTEKENYEPERGREIEICLITLIGNKEKKLVFFSCRKTKRTKLTELLLGHRNRVTLTHYKSKATTTREKSPPTKKRTQNQKTTKPLNTKKKRETHTNGKVHTRILAYTYILVYIE